jgi:hypothetical protein
MAGNNIYVQGSYIDVHDNENVYLSVDKAKVRLGDEPQAGELPQVLAESELWQKVKEAGLVDDDGQPTVSRPEAALLADMLAERLGIRNKWKFFEQLWHRNNMRSDYNTALEQRKSLAFQERLKNILG